MLKSLILFELNHLCYNYLTIFMFTLLIQITVYKLDFIKNSDLFLLILTLLYELELNTT